MRRSAAALPYSTPCCRSGIGRTLVSVATTNLRTAMEGHPFSIRRSAFAGPTSTNSDLTKYTTPKELNDRLSKKVHGEDERIKEEKRQRRSYARSRSPLVDMNTFSYCTTKCTPDKSFYGMIPTCLYDASLKLIRQSVKI